MSELGLAALSDELETLVAKATPAVAGIEVGRGQGTGFAVAQDGYLLTNHHVVSGAGPRKVRVRLADGRDYKGEVVGTDPQTDLGVIRVDATDLPSLSLQDPKRLRVGQLVVAIGNPFRFERSVSLGIVSAIDRSLPGPSGRGIEGLIQTDAAINPGNSGGPLLSARGDVVGINTAVVPFAQGIGFAVPASTASWVTAVLVKSGRISRRYLGIAARSEALNATASVEVGQPRGVRVMEVMASSPADVAGMRSGDLLLSVNGAAVANVDDLQRVLVLSDRPGAELEVWRGRARVKLSVTPASAQAA